MIETGAIEQTGQFQPLGGVSDMAAMSVRLLGLDAMSSDIMTQWQDLADNAAHASPFYQPGMLIPAIRAYARGDDIRLLVISDGTALIALFPVVLGDSYAKLPIRHLQTWRHVHFYDGTPLIRSGAEQQFFDALRHWINTRPDNIRFLRLRFLPLDKVNAELLGTLGTDYKKEQQFERAFLDTSQNFEDLMASVYTGKKRKELRRQWRRLNEIGPVRLSLVGAFDTQTPTPQHERDRLLDDFTKLESKGWKGQSADTVGTLAHLEFFTNAMRDAFDRGCALGVGLYQQSQAGSEHLIAMLICIRHTNEAYAYKTAFDEDLAAYSPGIHVLMEATQTILERSDIKTLDSCAKPDHSVADTLWPQRRPVADILIPARDNTTRRLLKGARAGAHAFAKYKSLMTGPDHD